MKRSLENAEVVQLKKKRMITKDILKSYTIPQLKTFLRDRDICGYSKLNKEKVLELSVKTLKKEKQMDAKLTLHTLKSFTIAKLKAYLKRHGAVGYSKKRKIDMQNMALKFFNEKKNNHLSPKKQQCKTKLSDIINQEQCRQTTTTPSTIITTLTLSTAENQKKCKHNNVEEKENQKPVARGLISQNTPTKTTLILTTTTNNNTTNKEKNKQQQINSSSCGEERDKSEMDLINSRYPKTCHFCHKTLNESKPGNYISDCPNCSKPVCFHCAYEKCRIFCCQGYCGKTQCSDCSFISTCLNCNCTEICLECDTFLCEFCDTMYCKHCEENTFGTCGGCKKSYCNGCDPAYHYDLSSKCLTCKEYFCSACKETKLDGKKKICCDCVEKETKN